jgi:hypothetical protein
MSFTVANAQTRAEGYIDEDIEDADAIAWTVDFLREKTDTRLWAEDEEEYTAVEEVFQTLPTGFVSVIKVETDAGDTYDRYLIRSGEIAFEDSDTYTLTYRKAPTALTLTTATVPLSDLFLSPVAYFLASRQRSKDDAEDPDAMKWMAESDRALRKVLGKVDVYNVVVRRGFSW